MESKWYNFNHFLFSFLSPLSSLYSFLFSLTSVLSHRFPLFSATPIPSVLSFPFNLRSVWRWPLSPEVQAAWAMSLPLTAHEPSSSPSHRHRSPISPISLSLSLLVVGCFDCCWLAEICGSALMWVTMWVLGRRWCGFWVGIVGVRFEMGEGWWRLLRMI